MRLRYRKTIIVFLGLQTTFLWCYILLGPAAPSLKVQDLNPVRLDNIAFNDISSKGNKSKRHTEGVQLTNGDCIGTEVKSHLLQIESWNAVDEAKTVFVFSAYRVDQSGKIKVVGAIIKRAGPKVFCQYWHAFNGNQSKPMIVKPAAVRILPENHGNKYSGAVFECPNVDVTADYISLVTKQCSIPSHLLVIKDGIKPQNFQRKFTICLKPLHFRYGRAYELVEWIEFNKILGAEKIVVYNYSIAINTNQVLKHYVKQGFVEVVQWNLPIRSYSWPKTKEPVDIHSIGMLPMLQDCLLRNRAHSEFVINLDVDEFIIPRSDNVTWFEMVFHLPSSADTYLFRNVFFRKEWNDSKIEFPQQDVVRQLRMISLQTFEREDKILPARSRSKYFTKTSKDNKILTIHDVSGGGSHIVPVEIGLLHHYRNWQEYNDAKKRISDFTVLQKYGQNLINKTRNAWKAIGHNVTLDIPI